MLDHAKFSKLMMLTQSPNDNEALAALRKATSLLEKSGLNWADFLEERKATYAEETYTKKTWAEGPTPRQAAYRAKQLEKEKIIKMMLKDLLHVRQIKSPRTKEFIQSLAKQFMQQHWLTPKQYDALSKIYYQQ